MRGPPRGGPLIQGEGGGSAHRGEEITTTLCEKNYVAERFFWSVSFLMGQMVQSEPVGRWMKLRDIEGHSIRTGCYAVNWRSR